MSLFDETIRLAGRPAVIIRTPSNINTFVVDDMYGRTNKVQLDPSRDYEFIFRFRTDSGLATGDLVTIMSDYYLVMVIKEEWVFGNLEYYRVKLFKCSSVVSIYYFNSITKKFDTLHSSNVQCLITSDTGGMSYDQGLAVKGYIGKNSPLQVYMRGLEGLTTESILVDQDKRRYKVSKNLEVSIMDNVAQTSVSLEG